MTMDPSRAPLLSGDYVVAQNGNLWTIAFVYRSTGSVPRMALGRHALIVRPHPRKFHSDMVWTVIHESKMRFGFKPGPVINPGEKLWVDGESVTVHRADPVVIFCRREDSTFTSVWRWQVALEKALGGIANFHRSKWHELPMLEGAPA